ncbi:tetratricopeptide repeat protein [Chitinophaga sp. GCM10012297]|uniref:Tetratricopeptide repeat protein n=1 Tax=Chitinophaga chungangae TaxID=2821488 RepID=A0ABS3Y8C2_9BACT|nr:tetratricopeptide repeat protein [Chitinophaga chungangae]MBO9150578.1 tetratricopeptide repeat protein [Chitinophaga chungangae]
MNRRKSLFVAMLCIANGAMAQSVEDGLKDLYYGKYQTAKQNLEKAITAKPEDARAYYYLGIAELGLENKDAAAAAFSKGLTAVPNSPLLTAGLGRIDLLNGKTAEAKQKFESASTATEGRDGDVARAIADANTEVTGGDRGYALTVMEKLLNNEGRKKRQMYEATAADYIELGDAYRYLGGENGGKAITSYEKAMELDANNAEAVMKQGLVNYNAKLLQQAVADWAKATNMDANYAPAYFELYQFYITPRKEQFSLEHAAKYLQKYVEVGDPSDKAKNEYYLAAIAFYQKDYDGAIAKAKALMGSANEAYKGKLTLLAADANLQKGDSLSAKALMDEHVKAVGNDKLEVNDLKLLSAIYGKLKSSDSATQANYQELAGSYLERYAEADTTKDAEKFRNVAEAFKEMRNYGKAAEWYGKALEFKDNSGAVSDHFYKGFYEYYAGKYSTSDSTWAAFTAKYPEQVTGFYWHGMANAAMDTEAKEGKAKAPFEKYVSLVKPEDEARNKRFLTNAYTYLMLYYYNLEDKAGMQPYMDKLLAFDPNNDTVRQVKENLASTEKAASAAASKAAAKGTK